MLSLSEAITSIKMDTGIYGLVLPFENGDQALEDVIKLKTIPTYSISSPYRVKVLVKGEELNQVERLANYVTYTLPVERFGRKIVDIDKVTPATSVYMGGAHLAGGFSICDYKNMMLDSVNAQMAHYAAPKVSHEFIDPNKLRLYNYGTRGVDLILDMQFYHDTNLSTIDEGHRESFLTLALLDVKSFLYNTLKNYSEIQTAYGSVKLPIDEWSNAASDRIEYLKNLDEVAHLEGDAWRYI